MPDQPLEWDVTALYASGAPASLAIVSRDPDGTHFKSKESGGAALGPRLYLELGPGGTAGGSAAGGSGGGPAGGSGTGGGSTAGSSGSSGGGSGGAPVGGGSSGAGNNMTAMSGCGCGATGLEPLAVALASWRVRRRRR